jgi:hypothetical protein
VNDIKQKRSAFAKIFKHSGLDEAYSRNELVEILESHNIIPLKLKNKGLRPMQVSKKKLRNCMLAGLDDDIRGAVWKLISKIPLKRSYYNNNMYEKLLSIPCTEDDEICIGKDLFRTITGFAAFKIDPSTG